MKRYILFLFILCLTLSSCVTTDNPKNTTCEEGYIHNGVSCVIKKEAEDYVIPTVDIEIIELFHDKANSVITLNDPDGILVIDSIVLLDDNEIVKTFNYENRLFLSDLEESKEYSLKINYHYNLGGDDINETTQLSFQTISRVTNYFCDIALGFEFGGASRITRRWNEPMKIYIDGEPEQELLLEIDRIIEEINELVTNGFYIEIVEKEQDSNFIIVFSDADYYSENYNINSEYTDSNWGLFFVSFSNYSNTILSGSMYVDIERTNLVQAKHLLREELTQSLGLARDSNEYYDSIFQMSWTTVTEYTDLDRDLIWLLYHPNMDVGYDKNDVIEVIDEIIELGMPNHEETEE